MRVFVTGGTGFVGKNLVKRLVKEGHEVVATGSPGENDLEGVKLLFPGLGGINWRQFLEQKFDVVFHQAANNDTRCQDREEMFKANLTDPMKLFQYAIEGGCRRFVYASSTAVYGDSPAPYYEDATPVRPLNVYAESKAAFDEYAKSMAQVYNISVVGLRYCNVYGPGEGHKGRRMSMIGQMARQLRRYEKVKLFEYGEQKRDWVSVHDVVEANILAMNSQLTGIYNIGTGEAVAFLDLVREIAKFVNPVPVNVVNHVEFIKHPFPNEYQSHTECNIDKARKDFGYEPKYHIQAGLADYMHHLSVEEMKPIRKVVSYHEFWEKPEAGSSPAS